MVQLRNEEAPLWVTGQAQNSSVPLGRNRGKRWGGTQQCASGSMGSPRWSVMPRSSALWSCWQSLCLEQGLSSASRTSLLRFHQPSMQSKLFPYTSSLCCYLSINVFQLALMEILNKVWKLKECEKPFLLLLELDIKKVWSIPCWAFVFKPWHVHARNSGERGYVLCVLSRLGVGCLVSRHGGKTLRAWQPFLRKQNADRSYRPLYRCWFSPPKKSW